MIYLIYHNKRKFVLDSEGPSETGCKFLQTLLNLLEFVNAFTSVIQILMYD